MFVEVGQAPLVMKKLRESNTFLWTTGRRKVLLSPRILSLCILWACCLPPCFSSEGNYWEPLADSGEELDRATVESMAANFDRVYRSLADEYSLWKEEAREFNACLWGITIPEHLKKHGAARQVAWEVWVKAGKGKLVRAGPLWER